MPNTLSTYSFFRLFLSRFFITLWLIFLGYGVFFLASQTPWKSRILYVVDTSLSMAVEDGGADEQGIMRDRLSLAQELMRGVRPLWDTEQALIAYARSASLILPFSRDQTALIDTVKNLRVTDVFGGSDISTALTLVDTLYKGNTTPMTIVLISDGGNTGDSTFPPLPPLSRLVIVCVGTDTGGRIPMGDNIEGERRYKIYEGKEIVVSYDAASLMRLATHSDTPVTRLTSQSDIVEIQKKIREKERVSSFFHDLPFLSLLGALCIIGWLFIHPYRTHLWKKRW